MGLSLERIFTDMQHVPFPRPRLAQVPAREREAGVQAVTTGDRFPFPIPFGWFCVGYPDEVHDTTAAALLLGVAISSAGATKPATGARHGRVSVRTSGAHLGHGGNRRETARSSARSTGWKYDVDRSATRRSPTANATNGKATVSHVPCRSSATVSCTRGTTPTSRSRRCGRCRSSPSSTTTPNWSTDIRTHYEVETTWAGDGRERGSTPAHFRYVHDTATVPDLESYETEFPHSHMRSSQKVPDAAAA